MNKAIQGKIRILVAEQHELILLGLRSLFDNHPTVCLVAECDNLNGVLSLAAKHMPDIILFDLLLNGGQCIEYIPRLLRASPQSKILAFSSNNDEQIYLDALRLGAAGIFSRYQSAELLLKAIHVVNTGQVWIDGQITKLLPD